MTVRRYSHFLADESELGRNNSRLLLKPINVERELSDPKHLSPRDAGLLVPRSYLLLLGSAILMVGLACSENQPPTKSTDPAGRGAPAPYRVYVTNETSGDLTVIASGTHEIVATIPLGKRPRGIAVAPDATRLYVALSGSPPAPPGVDASLLPPPDRSADGIAVVDLATDRVTAMIHSGSDPEQLAVGTDGTRLYVANEDAGEVSVVDITSGDIVARLPVGGEPEGVAISPDGRFVYVTSEDDGNVSVIDTGTNHVFAQFMVGARPRAAGFSPNSSRAYVTAENGKNVSVVDTTEHRVVDTITLTGENVRPMGVAVSPDGTRIYVTTGRGGTVVALDAASGMPIGSVAVGERPWGVALSPNGRYLYTANGPSNDVSVVDTDTLTVVTKISAGERPWGVAVVAP